VCLQYLNVGHLLHGIVAGPADNNDEEEEREKHVRMIGMGLISPNNHSPTIVEILL
jgi:hypothetical protein